ATAGLRTRGLDARGREAERRRLRGDAREKIREMLTPEQRTRYDAMVAAQDGGRNGPAAGTPARVFSPGPDGAPRAVPISIGASDGSYSEVLAGDLRPGQEVIVGQTGATAPARRSGPRLRF
ncbi:MAG: efflux RND transporter periplasmic adaptor subunit, partial [Candidatus Rokuibacteriota bacterium]